MELPPDFKDFLRLLNAHAVRYLLVGGHAVGYHGYPRATGDLDIWIARDADNAERVVAALREFGFDVPELSTTLFQQERRIVRMGLPPIRIEVITTIDGVEFAQCYPDRVTDDIDGVEVPIISLPRLRENKRASGRPKDLDDLENLP